MERKTKWCLLLVASLTAMLFTINAIGAELGYKIRGQGPSLRLEGIKKEKKAGELELISFGTSFAKWVEGTIPDQVNIKFLSLGEQAAFISVRETNSLHGYRMDAQRSIWPSGTVNNFSWPTADVIKRLKIEPYELSYIITERKFGGSGLVYPAIVHSNESPIKIDSYQLIVRSNYTCKPLTWALSNVMNRAWNSFAYGSLKSAIAKKGHLIELDFSQFKEGWYKVRLTCEREGQGSGGGKSNKQSRYYEFYHRGLFH